MLIINAIRQVVEKTPAQLVADIMKQEIVMTGGVRCSPASTSWSPGNSG